ncbi:RNA polymerase Rpb6 [Pyrolobus fumarii 1A]|uniref:DNA-directed RNA polymerase subunit Rpo6 n=1 Tax=Pyrolobus fumarii (strain DSM 11204 / 1A) TaxID=694429 RepID=G0EDJ7_PYRF1|nr:DNA-directed RNA polymerase subunit K [Pyrolobus fumarii]AEM39801.1 RNA polymerase Rpb6 [Pyrolobus fumarii 1A]
MSEAEKRFEVKIGPPWLTRFERARIIGARALQLSLGAPPLIDTSRLHPRIREDPVLVARVELAEGVLPITVLRYTRRGEYQAIPLQVLLEGMKRVEKYWTRLFLDELPAAYAK